MRGYHARPAALRRTEARPGRPPVTAQTRRTRRGRARRPAQTRRVALRPSFTAVVVVEHTHSEAIKITGREF